MLLVAMRSDLRHLRQTKIESPSLALVLGHVIPDIDIWRSALILVKRYGEDAPIEAAKRADELLAEGDMEGAAVWRRILSAVEQLQAEAPPNGVVH